MVFVLACSWMVLVIMVIWEHNSSMSFYKLLIAALAIFMQLGSKRVLQDANVLCHFLAEADLSSKPVALPTSGAVQDQWLGR